ncbi:MAG: EutN/CcmL family microcompartment protein [Elusimicrobia bacterium]|nr:EutN/CcmL family microcompartment protein [Elusimicrobiota bacterium]
MRAGKVIGRVVCTAKYPTLEGKKMLMLLPLSWREVEDAINNGAALPAAKKKSILALDAVGAGAGEYVFYVSSKEACMAFEDEPVCHNAIVGIIDGVFIE